MQKSEMKKIYYVSETRKLNRMLFCQKEAQYYEVLLAKKSTLDWNRNVRADTNRISYLTVTTCCKIYEQCFFELKFSTEHIKKLN